MSASRHRPPASRTRARRAIARGRPPAPRHCAQPAKGFRVTARIRQADVSSRGRASRTSGRRRPRHRPDFACRSDSFAKFVAVENQPAQSRHLDPKTPVVTSSEAPPAGPRNSVDLNRLYGSDPGPFTSSSSSISHRANENGPHKRPVRHRYDQLLRAARTRNVLLLASRGTARRDPAVCPTPGVSVMLMPVAPPSDASVLIVTVMTPALTSRPATYFVTVAWQPDAARSAGNVPFEARTRRPPSCSRPPP